MSRVIVGTCQECGENLRVKTIGVKESMNLTCKCGAKNIIHPPNDLVINAEEERIKKTNLAETSEFSNICDICGKALGSEDVIVVPPSVVVTASNSGFSPSRLPMTWKEQYEQQGMELGVPGELKYHTAFSMHWILVVERNASEDWGICKECKEEIDLYMKSMQSN